MKTAKRLAVAAMLARTAKTFVKSQAKQTLLSMTIRAKTASQYASKLIPPEDFLVARGKRRKTDNQPLALSITEDLVILLRRIIEGGQHFSATVQGEALCQIAVVVEMGQHPLTV